MRAASNSFIRPKYTGIAFRVQLLGLFMLLRCICNAVTSGSLAAGGADDMCSEPGCEHSDRRGGLHITLSMLVYLFIFLQDGQGMLTFMLFGGLDEKASRYTVPSRFTPLHRREGEPLHLPQPLHPAVAPRCGTSPLCTRRHQLSHTDAAR